MEYTIERRISYRLILPGEQESYGIRYLSVSKMWVSIYKGVPCEPYSCFNDLINDITAHVDIFELKAAFEWDIILDGKLIGDIYYDEESKEYSVCGMPAIRRDSFNSLAEAKEKLIL